MPVKRVFRGFGGAPSPIGSRKGWTLKIFKGRMMPEYDEWKVADESDPIVFMPVIALPKLERRETGHLHDTYKEARKEGFEMLSKK